MPESHSNEATRRVAPRWLWIAVLAIAASALFQTLGRGTRAPAPVPLKTAYWFWHQPFRLNAGERDRLSVVGVERLYVLAGTVVRRGPALALVSKQAWKEISPVPLVGVLRVEHSALEALLGPDGGSLALELLRKAGLPDSAIGVQWDADVPTARLPDYARVLREVRTGLPQGRLLSITALPDWLSSPGYAPLCDTVDEIAPQFYGNSWPREGREPPTLWEADHLVEQVRRAAAGRARVWVGLPAYGRCLVADSRGRFGGVRHDLDPGVLLEDPLWETGHASTREAVLSEEGTPAAYEDALLLRSREETLAGSVLLPAATSLWFQWPRVEGLRAAAAELSRASIPGVEGVSLFRWPVLDEPLSLLPVKLDPGETAHGSDVTLRLERDGDRISVVVRNEGDDSPRLAGGLRVEVAPAGGEVVARSAGAGFQGTERSSLQRADRVRFERPVLRPGARWTPCEIVHPRGLVMAEVHWTDSRGPRVTAARLNAQAVGKEGVGDAPR